MKALQNRMLKLLFESEENVLDNEELINTLNDSKVGPFSVSTEQN